MTSLEQQSASTLVVGLGLTGLSVVEYLYARGKSVSIADQSSQPDALTRVKQQMPDVEFRSGEFDANWFAGFSTIIVSPGVPLDNPAIAAASAAGVDVFGDIELYARQATTPVLAVTGSNGKSTVATLLGDILNKCGVGAAVAGNIGVPILSLLDSQSSFEFHVIELSSFQLESTTSLNAKAAALLNLSADHMDRYEDLDAYLEAKARIFADETFAVLNRDDAKVLSLQSSLGIGRCLTIGYEGPHSSSDYGLADCAGKRTIVRGDEPLLEVAELSLAGAHNHLNVMAAIALAEQAGVEPAAAAQAACAFTGLAHRMEVIGEWHGVRWINDSKGTNVGATVAAVTGSDRPVVLIAGGIAKQTDFSDLARALGNRSRAVVLMGRDADVIEQALSGVAVFRAEDMQQAIDIAASIAVSGDSVLLSPACASFDMFNSFEHRGDVFRSLVRARYVS